MKGHTFSDDEDVICTANGWLEDQEQLFFYNGIVFLQLCTKCISVAGDYVEKRQNKMCDCAYLVVDCVTFFFCCYELFERLS